MTRPLSVTKVEELRAKDAARTPGEWRWFGCVKFHNIYLATVDKGRQFVMTFAQWGLSNATPLFQVHRGKCGVMVRAGDLVTAKEYSEREIVGLEHPDAKFIADCSLDVPRLIATIDSQAREIVALRQLLQLYASSGGRTFDGMGLLEQANRIPDEREGT
jgi:hypothetical protein